VRRPLGEEDSARILVATFATPRARLDEQEAASEFAAAYHTYERNQSDLYLQAFAALLFSTILLAVAVGVLVVRPVTRGIARLAAATRPVAAGDLSVRVAVTGADEVADLGRSFNRMLEELEQSRARVEFLKQMSEWQKMARRLAHEIKNPLTPIQLAVEECHRRYAGEDAAYKKIVETMLEVVGEEIASLRRLVTEFSSFARLPRAELTESDLGVFLREQEGRIALREEGGADVDVTFDVPEAPMPAAIDREMLHRVLTNIVTNAAQAVRDARPGGTGRVALRAVAGPDEHVLTVDDDGPGIAEDVRASVFDPYVTTKRDGTGLGLSIVKKIVVDHGGRIDASASPLGGARFTIRLPRAGSPAAIAAAEALAVPEGPPPSSRRISKEAERGG
jgi:two-component system, NtrC family, nitrogen regulation sensor histidine kinase NtrY